MRADRLVATVLVLQAKGRVTAAQLARELEVSVATSRRDLEALSAAGVPVYPQRGRGGGWSLVGGARTDLSGLTSTEATALFFDLGPRTNTPAVASAVRKLLRALPAPFREDAEQAAGAVLEDPAPWSGPDAAAPDLLQPLREAVVARYRVRLAYTDRAGSATQRAVDPWGLVDKDGVWYLVAGTEAGPRTFRLDRVTDAAVTDVAFERPADVDLPGAWGQVVAEVEAQRSSTSAVVEVPARLLWVLQRQFGRHCQVHDADEGTDEDRVRVHVAAPTPLMIAQHLAGWGATLTVLEPEAVRAELARLGAELVRRYEPAADLGTQH